MESYKTSDPKWETVLDLDELGKKEDVSWVWKGSRPLPRARDPLSNNGIRVTRALLSLSRGGADATHLREFDLLSNEFVSKEDGGFILPEAKTRASYKSRDVLLVGSDFGPGTLTDSGYPRTVREWVRGTEIEDAKVVFEGEKTDVSVSAYIDDQRHHDGPIYEVRSRALTFYTSKYWARTVKYEDLLAPNDPLREGVEEPGDFVEVDVQMDANIDFVGKWMIISLRSDWEPTPGGKQYKKGSLLYVDAETILTEGSKNAQYHILFEPTERSAYETYSITKNYLILNVIENVKSKHLFFKFDKENDGKLVYVGGDNEAQIRACYAGSVDPYESDEFWFTTSGYTQPSTLFLADVSKVGGKTNEGEIEKELDEENEEYILEKLKSLPPQYDAEGLTVTQCTAISKDGTEIPYFLVSKNDTVLDGNTPTLLYGYGGFEISLGPKYIATSGISWLERGGAYVEANIRGGGEFGPSWHQAALKENRNKSYEDFIAVAEHLISTNICKPSTLAARGGSNGGLLMGNMYTMRPDLFGAIHCAVPLLDMKRYHKLLAGASWMAEYGDPDTSDWEDFLYKYSPYHNINPTVEKYPPMLVTTSTRDDRVHPAHARKMVKKLWDMGDGKDWPVYYYENIEGGHGGAADSKQSAFMTSLAYDFMWNTLCKGKST
uniref:Prolyl endopeptidase n=1 Tax=Helicotheca tamesis TaxID=374047 RepID=A0A7S2HZ48_9STRA